MGLFDVVEGCCIAARYFNATIPSLVPRIFAVNSAGDEWFADRGLSGIAALCRADDAALASAHPDDQAMARRVLLFSTPAVIIEDNTVEHLAQQMELEVDTWMANLAQEGLF